MRVGLYGGSFDPIHYGHLHPVRAARDALGLDRVIYLPTAHPPHKTGRRSASALARYAMVELALLGEPGMFVSTFELTGDVAYTVVTLQHFRRTLPQTRLFLILGSDSFAELDAWRDWRRILELAELAVLERPAPDARQPSAEVLEVAAGRVHRVENTPVAVSSTEVRRRLAARDTAPTPGLRDLVPPLVLDYICKYDLYRSI